MKRLRKYAGILTLALLLTACGKDSSEPAAAPAQEVTAQEASAQTATEMTQAKLPPVMLYRTKDDGTAALQGYDTVSENVEKPEYTDVLRLPEEIDGLKVTAIDAEGFADADYFGSVDFPERIFEMGDGCFRNSTLSDLTLHETLPMTYGNEAFAGCEKLEHVWLTDSDMTFGNDAFTGCTGMADFHYQEGTLIAGNNFCAGLTGMWNLILDCDATLGKGAFSGCTSLTHIDLSGGTVTLGDDCFTGCTGTETLLFTEAELHFGSGCFAGCSTESLTISDCTGEIGDNCFTDCKEMQYVLIQEGITKIGAGAFAGCDRIETFDIPASVTEIGEGAFADCGGAMLMVPAGSYAAKYAEGHGLEYIEK